MTVTHINNENYAKLGDHIYLICTIYHGPFIFSQLSCIRCFFINFHSSWLVSWYRIESMSKEARPTKTTMEGFGRGGAPQYPVTLHTGKETITMSYCILKLRSIALYTVFCSNLPTFSSTDRKTAAVLMSLQVWEGRGTYGGTQKGAWPPLVTFVTKFSTGIRKCINSWQTLWCVSN